MFLHLFFFFLKAPNSIGESSNISSVYADRTQRRRSCLSSLETQILTLHAHTFKHTQTRDRWPPHPEHKNLQAHACYRQITYAGRQAYDAMSVIQRLQEIASTFIVKKTVAW